MSIQGVEMHGPRQTVGSQTVGSSPASRFFRALPVIGGLMRAIERDIHTIYYILVIALTALVLAIQTWGLAALVVTAVALVPVIFILLICVTLP